MRGRRASLIAGLGLLLALDLVLVFWALNTTRGTASVAAQTPKASSAAPSGSASPSASAKPSAKSDEAVQPLERLLAPVDATTIWVGDMGTCDSPGSVMVSADGGKNWENHAAAGSVTRVKATSGLEAFVVGGDASCKARLWATSDGAATWSAPQSADSAWGRDPEKPGRVLLPSGGSTAPCGGKPVIDLALASASAAGVLCADGSVLRTTDSGATWPKLLDAAGGLALTMDAEGAGFLASQDAACSGTLVSSFSGATQAKGVCVEDAAPVAGKTALAAAPNAVMFLVGEELWGSTDNGKSFTKTGTVPQQ